MLYTIAIHSQTPSISKTTPWVTPWWAEGLKHRQLAYQVGAGAWDPECTMDPSTCSLITKFQPGEVFSFGAFTFIVDKFGDMHAVSDCALPPEPRHTPQAPAVSASKTSTAGAKQIQSAKPSVHLDHSAAATSQLPNATRASTPLKPAGAGPNPDRGGRWRTVVSKRSAKKDRATSSHSMAARSTNHSVMGTRISQVVLYIRRASMRHLDILCTRASPKLDRSGGRCQP